MTTASAAEDCPDHDEPDASGHTSSHNHKMVVDWLKSAVGGVITAIVAAVAIVAVGRVGDYEALHLLEVMLPTTRFMCSSIMTAAATILALMLTLLSLSMSADHDFKPIHYRRVKQIALVDTIAFIFAAIFLLLLGIPLGESENVPTDWFAGLYYGFVSASTILSGLLATIILMLYFTVSELIELFGLGRAHPDLVNLPEDE